MVAEVPLVDGETPALRFGAAIAAGWFLLGGLGLAGGVTGSAWARYGARGGSARPTPDRV
jgi:apolipoprotein N-acyltransferase